MIRGLERLVFERREVLRIDRRKETSTTEDLPQELSAAERVFTVSYKFPSKIPVCAPLA